MRSSVFFLLALLAALAKAYVQLQFPPPRGPFDASKGTDFCDGYATPAVNRTQFPVHGGYASLKSDPGTTWEISVLISTAENVTKINDFEFAYAAVTGTTPDICRPVDPPFGFEDGKNVTVLIMFRDGNRTLSQCADITLSNSSSYVSCQPTYPTSSPTSEAILPATAHIIVILTALIALSGLLLL